MNLLAGRFLLLILLTWAFLPLEGQVSAPIIRKIEVKHIGPPAVSDELVRANIRLKPGDPYLPTSVDQDVRSLYSTGFFANIRVGEENVDGGVILTYFVQGKPILTEIRFSGNTKFNRTRLLSKISSKVGDPLDERKLFLDSQEIIKLYQKSGYQRTAVKYAPSIDENAGRGSVTFEITESPKIKIVDVQFVGAQAFPEKKLRKVLKTRRNWFFSWITGTGKLKDEELEEDKERLAEFYRSAGYIDFELQDVQFDYITPTRLILRFILKEGVQYKVGSVEFRGNNLYTADTLRDLLPLKAGEIFTPRGLSRNVEALENFYGTRGYIDARISSQRNPNVERGALDLLFNIDERQPSYIERIEIKGNIKTKDQVIRRELAVAPGEIFDMSRVQLSTNRLTGLNYFEKIDAQAEPTEVPNRKNLVISVDEKSTGNVSLGAGFSTVDNVVGFVEMSQGNFDLFNPPYFTGGGQKFRLRTQIGTRRQDYQLSFIEPWFLGQKLALGVDLYHRDLNFQSSLYEEQRTGARLSLTRALGSDFLIGSVSYTIERAGIEIPDTNGVSPVILQEEGNRLISRVGGSLAYDTRNNGFLPDRGQRTELLAEISGGPFGGDVDIYRLELRTSWYFRGFFPGHVLEVVGRVGVVDHYADSKRVPLFDRYFLGGLYSLRGYDYRDIGPKDPTDEPLGGSTYWFGSVEYSVPIIERLRAAMFYDSGMVYQDAYSFSPGSEPTGVYNDNFGVGVRLNLPIGPLRLDYGIPLTRDPRNSNSGKFQFGVGYTRDF